MCCLHTVAFPGLFPTSLGPRFLRLLYAGFAREAVGIHVGRVYDPLNLVGNRVL